MSVHRRITWFTLLGGAVLALAFAMSLTHEPAYAGKRLSTWLRELGEDPPEKRASAVVAVREIGSNAAPAVIGLLLYKESAFKRKARELAAKQSLIKLSFEEPRRRRQRGFSACDALGPAALPAIPTLMILLTNERPPEPHIPYLLARIGPSAVPALAIALTNDEKVIRFGAKYCLELLRTNADFLHPERRPVEDQDYLRRTCEYNLAMIQMAYKEYVAHHGQDLLAPPTPSPPGDFEALAFEAAVQQRPKPQPTNAPSPFE